MATGTDQVSSENVRIVRTMERTGSDDALIVENVLAGDREAFSALVRAYQARVVRYCLTLMRNPVEAEEAAQDVFVKAFQSLRQFRKESSFMTWVGRIAHNHCMDLLRAKTRHKTDSLDAILEAGNTTVEAQAAEPEESMERESARSLVPALMASVKEEYREILMLREVQEMSYDDIAAALGCSLDAVKSRLRRARAEFHEKARHFLRKTVV